MTEQRMKTALMGLQWTLGLVILVEAVLFVMPIGAHDFANTHMPDAVRLVLGWGEIIGCILLLIPRTTVCGAWTLIAVVALAVVIHLLHGMYNVGNLLIYIAASWVVAAGTQATGGAR